jgi:hypothetical protein
MIVVKDKTMVIVALCIGAFALALVSRFYLTGSFVQMFNVAKIAGRAALKETTSRENFMQQEIGAPINDGGMQGVYSGIDISDGSSAPVSKDGWQPHDDRDIFLYQDSKFTPECCTTSSTSISNDSGCLCMSKKDEKDLAYRGGNRKAA